MNEEVENGLTPSEMILSGLADVDGKKRSTFVRRRSIKRNEAGANLFRRQMLDRIDKLPEDFQRKLAQDTAQISDKVLYAVKDLNGTSLKMFDDSDVKSTGTTNVKNGQYDRPFLCSAIRILYSSDKSASRFGDDMPLALAHGEFSMEIDGKEIIKDMPNEVCSNAGNEPVAAIAGTSAVASAYESNKAKGTYVLTNPKLFSANKDIRFDIDLTASLTSGSVKVMLIGTEVLPH